MKLSDLISKLEKIQEMNIMLESEVFTAEVFILSHGLSDIKEISLDIIHNRVVLSPVESVMHDYEK